MATNVSNSFVYVSDFSRKNNFKTSNRRITQKNESFDCLTAYMLTTIITTHLKKMKKASEYVVR